MRSGHTWIVVGLFVGAMLAACAALADFSGTFVAAPTWTHTKTIGSATVKATFAPLLAWTHADGTNANQMTELGLSDVSLVGSGTNNVNVSTLADSFGDAISIGRVRFLAVSAGAANVGALEVGGAASGAWATWAADTSDKLLLRPGGLLLFVAPDATGYTVGTSNLLRVRNTVTNAATFSVYIGGSL